MRHKALLRSVPGRQWILAILWCALAFVPRPVLAVSELDYGLEQHRLYRIEISGNDIFSDKVLKSLLKIHEPRRFHPLMLIGITDSRSLYQPHLLEVELKTIERYYKQRGYHEVEVSQGDVIQDPDGRGDIIPISIVEGVRTDLISVGFPGAEQIVQKSLRSSLHYHQGMPAPADLNDLGADLYLLRTGLWEKGHLAVTIDPQMTLTADPDSTRHGAILTYHIVPGPVFTVGEVRITGVVTTREDLIRKRLQVHSGETFRWSAIEDTRRRLVETSLFRDVSFTPSLIDTVRAITDLVVHVVERETGYFEFGFGVGSRERIRVLGGWGENNLFGTGQKLGLRVRNALNFEDVQRLSDGQGNPELNYRYELRHNHPDLIGRFGLETNVYAERETRGESGLNLDTIGLSLGTRFGFGRQTINSVVLQIEQVDPMVHPDAITSLQEAFETSGLTKSSTHSVGWNIFDEERDDPVRPKQGMLKTGLIEIAGGPMGGDNSFWKLSASLHGYTHFPLGGTLAVRVNAGVVQAYGSSHSRGADGVPYQERFFAGGVSSVRGYAERGLGPQITDQAVLDSLQLSSDVPLGDQPARGGNYRLLTNVEWRFPIPLLSRWHVGGVAFVDGGNVWEDIDEIRLQGFRWRSYPGDPESSSSTKLWDYRWSAGTGVRVDTPVGPVRVDVGFPLKRARLSVTETEDKVVYHFSLGYPF